MTHNTTTPRGNHNNDDASLDLEETEVFQAGLDAQRTLDAIHDTASRSDIEDLRHQIRNGERALASFIRRHKGALNTLASGITPNTEDQADLVAAGMSAIAEALAKWDPCGGASPLSLSWVVARRRMLTRRATIQRTMTGQPDNLQFDSLDAVQLAQQGGLSPETQAIESALIDELQQLHRDLGCCDVEPRLDRMACCEKLKRALRKSNRHTWLRSWLDAA